MTVAVPAWWPDSQAVQWRLSVRGEVKYELVTVVEKPVAVDRLVVTDRELTARFTAAIDRDRLDPVDDILKRQMTPDHIGHVHGGPGVGGF